MLMIQISTRVGSLIIAVFYHIFSFQLCGSQRSAPPRLYNCNTYGQTCVLFSNCPDGREQVHQRRAKLCGFQDRTEKICCGKTNPNITVGRTNYTSSARATPSPPQIASNTRPKNTSTLQKPATIAQEYCQKYEQYKYVSEWRSPQLPGRSGYWYNTTNCVNVQSLVVKGTPSQPKEYPHMALIGYGNDFQSVQWNCGGSLISEKFILSAAHCGKTTQYGAPKWVLLGDLDISKTTDDAKPAVYKIVQVHDYPDFKQSSRYNDISLFELNATVAMGPYVRPACLHTSTDDLRIGTKATITGWGDTGTGERPSNYLQKATISVVGTAKCRESFEKTSDVRLEYGYDANSMICAGDLKDGKDSCLGDSGGPLQTVKNNRPCMWNIIGITSFGPGICGNMEDPGVYTKVAFYLDWIQTIVWPQ